ncbi:hypothetical protein DID88_000007 [Monilinia fructigena]|uniref:Uncharacterized protein n=1 Tax=Monilinia fructigena TaxID=38457 RepID=A0A395IIU4_9HELO|nr:hypothetical protein DID88_000007 [Monilinia fructigena]
MSVDVSSALPKEGHPNAPLVTSPEPEPDIKVDPDEPMSLTNEHPKLPLIPALDDTSSNTIRCIYDGPDSYCHGLPNFEFKSQDVQVPPTIPASLTHVLPSQKSIVQNVVFLKDLVCHNYLSETNFLCQEGKVRSQCTFIYTVANNINRFATYSAIVLIWQSDGQFLRFWRSLIDPNYTLIEFTFSSAPWLSGFTIDTNNDGDLTKARQHIWDGFWIFINIESRSLNSKFRILAKPKLPYLLSVPSKRPTDSTHDLQRPCPRGKEKESSSKKTNEGEISSPRSDGQVPNGKAAPCDRSQSIGQTPIAQNLPTSSKRPVARPRVVSQQSNIALSPANAQINPPNLKQQQQQQQWSCQCQSPIISDALRSHFNPSSRRSPSDPTFKTQQNHLNLQPQVGIILAEPVRFLHVNAPRISHRSLQQYPNAQSSARMIPQPPMIQAHRPLIASRFPPQVNPNPSISRLIADTSQIHPSFLNCLPLVLPYPPPSPLSPPTSPQPHDPTANSISNLTPTILFRIQLSPNGPFSRPYSRSILGVPGQPPITTAQLFTWFKNEARIGNKQGPESLTFRLKDAVPVPITYTISRSGSVDGVDRLAKLKAGIKRECANAGRLIMGLEKFEIFVSVTEEEKEIQGMEEESNQIVGEEWSDTSRIR